MFKAIYIIENGGTQADAARGLNTGRGVISRMWSRYREFGSHEEQHSGKSKVATAAQDRFLCLRAFRERISIASMLRSALQNVGNVVVSTQTIRNTLPERGLNARRSLACLAIRRVNREPRVLLCQQHENWIDMINEHVWIDENSHAVEETRHQHRFSINVWSGVLGDRLIGPCVLPQRLTGARYQDFLINVLPTLLQYVPCQQRLQMWFMHDDTPAHFFRNEREHLTLTFQDHWIDWRGTTPWLARSSNINPLDFLVINNNQVQRRWRVQFGTQPPTRLTITTIRDKFEVDGTLQDVLKGRCRRKRSSTDNESVDTIMQAFAQSPKKSMRQCSHHACGGPSILLMLSAGLHGYLKELYLVTQQRNPLPSRRKGWPTPQTVGQTGRVAYTSNRLRGECGGGCCGGMSMVSTSVSKERPTSSTTINTDNYNSSTAISEWLDESSKASGNEPEYRSISDSSEYIVHK
ncbi:hypothetical protein ANN_13338 [Periplaneta americana]|uniref:DUF4817 domain-containing protein n=1 Tax=Periplaneta americana TaxID=6978 RepID=A0ABQ8TL61_PERAM|nr:hypothetical protein ANN_13338 [Periplaneta americana]